MGEMGTPRAKSSNAAAAAQQQNLATSSDARRRIDATNMPSNSRSPRHQQQHTSAFRGSPTNLQRGQPRSSSNNEQQPSSDAPRLYKSPRQASSRQNFESSSAPVSRSESPVSHSEFTRSQSRSNLHKQQSLRQKPHTYDSPPSSFTQSSATSPKHLLYNNKNNNTASHTNTATHTTAERVSYPHARIGNTQNTETNRSIKVGNERTLSSLSRERRERGSGGGSVSTSESGSSSTSSIHSVNTSTLRMCSECLNENNGVPESTVDRLNLPLWTLSVRGQKFQPPRHQDRVALSSLPREAQAMLASLHKSLDPIDLEHVPASEDSACCFEMCCSAFFSLCSLLLTSPTGGTRRERKLSTVPLDSQVHLLTYANEQLSHDNLHVVLVRQEQSCPGSTVLNYYLEVKPLHKDNISDTVVSSDSSEDNSASQVDDNINSNSDDSETPTRESEMDNKQCLERYPTNATAAGEAGQQTRTRRRSISKVSNDENGPDNMVIMRRTLLHSRSKTFGISASSLVSTNSIASANTINTSMEDSETIGRARTTEGGRPRRASANIKYLRLLSETNLETPTTAHQSDVDILRPTAARPDQELTVRDLLRGTRKWTSFRSRTSSSGTSGGRNGSIGHSDSAGGAVRERSVSVADQGLSRVIFKRSRSGKQTESSSLGGLDSRQGSSRALSECDENGVESQKSEHVGSRVAQEVALS